MTRNSWWYGDLVRIFFRLVKAKFSRFCSRKYKNHDEYASDSNDASIVTRVVYGSASFLGDADAAIEEKIMAQGNVKSTYLKAEHHGSNTSSSAAFNAARPVGTVLSYGKDTSYGHPHSDVVQRLNAVGSKIYSTAQSVIRMVAFPSNLLSLFYSSIILFYSPSFISQLVKACCRLCVWITLNSNRPTIPTSVHSAISQCLAYTFVLKQ